MEPDDHDDSPEEALQGPLLTEPISSLNLGPAITVPIDATLQHTVEVMQHRHLGCVLVVDRDGILKGIFTERDLLTRVAGRKLDWTSITVGEFMTADPESLQRGDGIAWALNLMSIGGYRHVPLIDDDGRPTGVVSVKDIIEFIVDLFPDEILNLPPDPRKKPGSDDVGGGAD
ncbi:MAG: cyclic nucleotide-binding/CBS domain-containing protein [Myxococcales bacterium]|nr:CBS domain-containing protein [Myxococcales bacterium]